MKLLSLSMEKNITEKTQVEAEPNGSTFQKVRQKRKSISGAKQKRRRKARQAALEAAGSTTVEQATPATTGPTSLAIPRKTGSKFQAGNRKPQGESSQPGRSQVKKRQRSDALSSEVSPQVNPKKKPPASGTTSGYSQMAASHLRVAVIDKQE